MGPTRAIVAGAGRQRLAPVAGRRLDQRGAATAETAMMMPLLVLTTVALVWLLSLGAAQIRVVDAAREVARAVARDEPRDTALALGRRIAPPGAAIRIRSGDGHVVVAVAAEVRGPGGLFRFVHGVSVDAEAVAATEAR